ncbi:efflux RND transporter periplasmic adaptor subunit [Shinella lacus]|uniref:efflux RND transporter periplasmic adaptor subunit n=1 Tax=Shinella lacus TaxID=2654216 RepID=UPI00210C0D0E|nr:efflux RND transporter periplasmic adaptor subunit [Shinella lacus]
MPRHSPRSWPALLIVLLVLQGCNDGDEPEAATDPAPVVSIVRAQILPLVSSITVTGSLIPHRVALVHAQTSGLVVTELLAEEGQTVRSGQVLARLSSERQSAELSGARGELHRAEQALARAQALKTSGTMAGSAADAATASYVEAQARVRALEIDVARAEVRAPVAGLLQRRNIEIGEVANEKPLFEIAAERAMELVVDLSETAWSQTSVGQSADITLADGQAMSGTVRRLSGALDSKTRLGRAWISLNNAPSGLVSGAGASARLRIGRADLLAIPQSSLLFDQQGAYVFVVADGKALRRAVTLGAQNAEHAEIIEGLNAGDAVVARAGSLLRDGDPVRIAAVGDDARGIAR